MNICDRINEHIPDPYLAVVHVADRPEGPICVIIRPRVITLNSGKLKTLYVAWFPAWQVDGRWHGQAVPYNFKTVEAAKKAVLWDLWTGDPACVQSIDFYGLKDSDYENYKPSKPIK